MSVCIDCRQVITGATFQGPRDIDCSEAYFNSLPIDWNDPAERYWEDD